MLTDDQHILRMRTDRGSALHHVPAVCLARLQPEHLARALVFTDLLRGIVLLADSPCNRGGADAGWSAGIVRGYFSAGIGVPKRLNPF